MWVDDELLGGAVVEILVALRRFAVAAKYPKVRAMRDNFSDVGQSIVVEKGDKVKLQHLNRMINEAISSGMVKASLERAKLAGVGVAPLGKATR